MVLATVFVALILFGLVSVEIQRRFNALSPEAKNAALGIQKTGEVDSD